MPKQRPILSILLLLSASHAAAAAPACDLQTPCRNNGTCETNIGVCSCALGAPAPALPIPFHSNINPKRLRPAHPPSPPHPPPLPQASAAPPASWTSPPPAGLAPPACPTARCPPRCASPRACCTSSPASASASAWTTPPSTSPRPAHAQRRPPAHPPACASKNAVFWGLPACRPAGHTRSRRTGLAVLRADGPAGGAADVRLPGARRGGREVFPLGDGRPERDPGGQVPRGAGGP